MIMKINKTNELAAINLLKLHIGIGKCKDRNKLSYWIAEPKLLKFNYFH